MEVVKLREQKEIVELLGKLDKDMQTHIGNQNLGVFKQTWLVRTTLLWVLGELESIN